MSHRWVVPWFLETSPLFPPPSYVRIAPRSGLARKGIDIGAFGCLSDSMREGDILGSAVRELLHNFDFNACPQLRASLTKHHWPFEQQCPHMQVLLAKRKDARPSCCSCSALCSMANVELMLMTACIPTAQLAAQIDHYSVHDVFYDILPTFGWHPNNQCFRPITQVHVEEFIIAAQSVQLHAVISLHEDNEEGVEVELPTAPLQPGALAATLLYPVTFLHTCRFRRIHRNKF